MFTPPTAGQLVVRIEKILADTTASPDLKIARIRAELDHTPRGQV